MKITTTKSIWANSNRFPSLKIMCGSGLPLDQRLWPWSHLSFFLKGSTYFQLSSFISLFYAYRVLVV